MTALRSVARALAWLGAWGLVGIAGFAPHAGGAPAALPTAVAESAGDAIGAAALAERIEAFVRERAGGADDRIEIPALDDFAASSSSGAPLLVELRTSAPLPLSGWVPITVAITDDTGELKRGIVTARVVGVRTALVASRQLPRGAIVTEADIREVPLDGPAAATGNVDDPGLLVGLRTLRAIRAGTPWRAEWVERPPAVRRGETVRVVFHSGGLRLELLGRAREDGHAGDRIRVLNPRSRTELIGRVAPDGVVYVGS